jgi:hypothetical protein
MEPNMNRMASREVNERATTMMAAETVECGVARTVTSTYYIPQDDCKGVNVGNSQVKKETH